MLLEMSECSGELLLSRHAVCPPIRYYGEASFFLLQEKFLGEKDGRSSEVNSEMIAAYPM